MIGETGVSLETDAALAIKEDGIKPGAGETDRIGRRMVHAGAIIGAKNDAATAKFQF